MPDGRYLLAVTAKAGAKSVTKTAAVTVDRTLSGLRRPGSILSPNGDGLGDTTTFSFNLAAGRRRCGSTSSRRVCRGASPFQGELAAGAHTLAWDGSANGAPLPDGAYVAVLTVTDALGDVRIPVPVTIDTAPTDADAGLDPHVLRFTLDEPATVTVLVNGTTRIVLAAAEGDVHVPFQGSVGALSAAGAGCGRQPQRRS